MSFVRAMLRQRALSFALLFLSLLAGVYGARSIRIHFQYRDFYAYPQNADFPAFERYSKVFGDPGGNVAVLLESDDVFRPAYLRYIDELSRDLEPSALFSRVRSLSTVRLVRADGDAVETGRLMQKVPETPEGITALRNAALNSKLLTKRVVSEDATLTAILAEMRTPASIASVAEEQAAVELVRRAVASRPPPPGLEVAITGGPAIEVASTHALLSDQFVLTPVVLVIIVVALILTFRSLHGVLLVLATVTVSVCWTAGVFGLLGRPVDMVGSIIPITLLVYGVVDPVFVLTRYLQKLESLGDRQQAILAALREMLLPCFLTSLTTALGFAAFISATMPTVRYLGLVVAIGVSFSFVTTVTVLPLLLSVVPPPKRQLSSLGLQRRLDAYLERAWRAIDAHRALTLTLALACLLLGIGAARGMQIDDAYVDVAPAGPERSAVRLAEQKLSGVVRYVAYFEGAPGSMKRPEVLQAIAAVDAAAERDILVNTAVSLPDLLAEVNQAFLGGGADERRLPTSPTLIAQYLTLIDPADRSDFVNDDYSQTHLAMLATDRGGVEGKRLREYLQRAVDVQGFDRLGVHVTLTGNGVVTYRELEKIVREILWGFVIAFGIVLAFELVMFRSLRIALISIIPNLLPVGVCLLAMRCTNIGFRLDTSLVLCISIGGLFNTTIHIVARIQQQLRAGARDPSRIVEHALRTVGPASFYTALILSLGFSALLLSSFPGLRALGGFALLTLITGFFSDAAFTTLFMRMFFDWRQHARPVPGDYPKPIAG